MTIKNNFPNKIEKERIKTLGKYEKLYENEQEAILKLHDIIKNQYKDYNETIYLAHAIPAKISDFYGDFVSGRSTQLSIHLDSEDSDELNTFEEIVEDNDIREKISDYATDQSQYGFEVLLGMVEDKEFKIQEVEQDQYFPQSDGSVIFATYYRDPESDDPLKERDFYLYTQHYRLEDEDVIIERKAWKCNEENVATEEVPLDYLGIEEEEEERIEGLGELPIVQIDNGRRTRWGFGKSDYHDIMPQLAEINERVTHISTQLLKNLNAILELQDNNTLVDEDNSLKPFDFVMLPDKDSVKTRYVTNENPLIEETFKHIDRQISMISWITGVPSFDISDRSQPERVESLKIRMFSAVRKTETKRMKIEKGIKDIINIGFKMLDMELDSTVRMEFTDVIPQDELKATQVEEAKVTAGLSSRASAMKRLDNLSKDEVDEEMERMRKEGIESGVLDPDRQTGL